MKNRKLRKYGLRSDSVWVLSGLALASCDHAITPDPPQVFPPSLPPRASSIGLASTRLEDGEASLGVLSASASVRSGFFSRSVSVEGVFALTSPGDDNDNELFEITAEGELIFKGEGGVDPTARGQNGRKESGGSYVVEVTVTDEQGQSYTQTHTITEGSLQFENQFSGYRSRGLGLLEENLDGSSQSQPIGQLSADGSSDRLMLKAPSSTNNNDEFDLVDIVTDPLYGRLSYTGMDSGDFENGDFKVIEVDFLPQLVDRNGVVVTMSNVEIPEDNFLYEVDPDSLPATDNEYHFQIDQKIEDIGAGDIVTVTLFLRPIDSPNSQAIEIQGQITGLNLMTPGTTFHVWAVQTTGGAWTLETTTNGSAPTTIANYQRSFALYNITTDSTNPGTVEPTVAGATDVTTNPNGERNNLPDHQAADMRHLTQTGTTEQIILSTETYIIYLNDQNDDPTDIDITNTALQEDSRQVGILSATDPDPSDNPDINSRPRFSFTYTLDPAEYDNKLFEIGSRLVVRGTSLETVMDVLNFKGDTDIPSSVATTRGVNGRKGLGETYVVEVEVSDGKGGTYTEQFTITEASLYLDNNPSTSAGRRYTGYDNGLLEENTNAAEGSVTPLPFTAGEGQFLYNVVLPSRNYYFLTDHDLTTERKGLSGDPISITLFHSRINGGDVFAIEIDGVIQGLGEVATETYYVWAVKDDDGEWSLLARTDTAQPTGHANTVFLYSHAGTSSPFTFTTVPTGVTRVEDVSGTTTELPLHFASIDLDFLESAEDDVMLTLVAGAQNNDEFRLIDGRLFYVGGGSGYFENGDTKTIQLRIEADRSVKSGESVSSLDLPALPTLPNGSFSQGVRLFTSDDTSAVDDNIHFATNLPLELTAPVGSSNIEAGTVIRHGINSEDFTVILYFPPVNNTPQEAIEIKGLVENLNVDNNTPDYIWAVKEDGVDSWSLVALEDAAMEPTNMVKYFLFGLNAQGTLERHRETNDGGDGTQRVTTDLPDHTPSESRYVNPDLLVSTSDFVYQIDPTPAVTTTDDTYYIKADYDIIETPTTAVQVSVHLQNGEVIEASGAIQNFTAPGDTETVYIWAVKADNASADDGWTLQATDGPNAATAPTGYATYTPILLYGLTGTTTTNTLTNHATPITAPTVADVGDVFKEPILLTASIIETYTIRLRDANDAPTILYGDGADDRDADIDENSTSSVSETFNIADVDDNDPITGLTVRAIATGGTAKPDTPDYDEDTSSANNVASEAVSAQVTGVYGTFILTRTEHGIMTARYNLHENDENVEALDMGDNLYEKLTVFVNDGDETSLPLTYTVTIRGENDAPTILFSDDSDATTTYIGKDSMTATDEVTFNIADVDAGDRTVTNAGTDSFSGITYNTEVTTGEVSVVIVFQDIPSTVTAASDTTFTESGRTITINVGYSVSGTTGTQHTVGEVIDAIRAASLNLLSSAALETGAARSDLVVEETVSVPAATFDFSGLTVRAVVSSGMEVPDTPDYSTTGSGDDVSTTTPATVMGAYGMFTVNRTADGEMTARYDLDESNSTVMNLDDDESLYEKLTVFVNDGNETGTLTYTVSIGAIDITVNEEETFIANLSGYELTNPTVSGDDANEVQITQTQDGPVLEFITAPDFENPADTGRNRVYDFTINDGSDSFDVDVTIADVDIL
jgi:VCBS repeat-containing protein